MPVMSISSATADEGDLLTFNVTLDAPAIDAVTVDYQALPGSADDSDLYYDLTSSRVRDADLRQGHALC